MRWELTEPAQQRYVELGKLVVAASTAGAPTLPWARAAAATNAPPHAAVWRCRRYARLAGCR
jgi:hypothetical protein